MSDTERPVKGCGCGLQYSAEAWSKLRFVGIQTIPASSRAPAEALELRDCHCGSTIGRRVEAA